MPALSPTMTKGGVTTWLVSEGQKVSAGDVLAEIQTDKATMEMESMEDGFVAKILIEAGREDIDVGTPLLVMVEDEKDVASFKEYVGGKGGGDDSGGSFNDSGSEAEETRKEEERVAASASASTSSSSFATRGANETRVFISPLARKTALEKGVDYTKIRGRGPNGRVTNLDVLEYVASGGVANVKSSAQQQQQQQSAGEFDASIYFPEYEEVPVSTIKKITAKRLTESKQTVPHFYLTVDVNMDAVNATRAQ